MADAEGGDILSELCTICHTEVPKYRCPRCSARTCSLKCNQKHKKWSQCSGVRDPTTYLRRSQLVTPAAFDRDFNFITGIERGLERAERDTENRGIPLEHNYVCSLEGKGGDSEANGIASKKRKRPADYQVKGEAGFLRGVETAGVNLIRAPKGMTRSKQNSSRWHAKHKCLSWTIEWISPDGTKTLRNSTESIRIFEAYDNTFARTNDEKRLRKQQQPSQLTQGPKPSQNLQSTTDTHIETTMGPHIHNETRDVDKIGSPAVEDTNSTDTSVPISDGLSALPTITDAKEQDTVTAHRGVYFYLSCPRKLTKLIVLAPLHPKATLQASLRNRTLIEFPTIYVLPLSPTEISEQLKDRFLLENEYHHLHQLEESQPQISGLLAEDRDVDEDDNIHSAGLSPGQLISNETTSTNATEIQSGNVDEQKVLQALKEDLFEATTS